MLSVCLCICSTCYLLLSPNASSQFYCASVACQLSTSNSWGQTLGACLHGPCDLRVCACSYAGARRHDKKEGAAPQSDLQGLPNFFRCRSCAFLPLAFYFSCSCHSADCSVFVYSCNRCPNIPIFLFSWSYSRKFSDTMVGCSNWRCTVVLVLFFSHCFLFCPFNVCFCCC